MKLAIPKTKVLLLLSLFIATLIASRVVNLNKTARFIWDESSDLVSMHQIYVEKKPTLIGPISEDGSKVFGSLTYYMLLPFAVIGHFDPVSTAYGAAFWGFLTGILMLYLTFKVNKKIIWLAAPIIILWYPLVETGRWAWNPNLIPFWVTLSIIFYFRDRPLSKFLSGLFIGLAVHHHYLSIFAVAGLGLIVLFESIKGKEIKKFFAFAAGVALAITPFVAFDLRHPPGLFLSRVLYFNHLGGNSLFAVLKSTFQYFTRYVFLEIALVTTLVFLIAGDIKEKLSSLKFIGVFIIQIVGLSFISDFYTHYTLPVIPFFLLYLIYPRRGVGKILSYTALIILLISSILSFPKQITAVTWEGDIASTRFIANTIGEEIREENLKNNNIGVLDSPDPNTYGRRYRDLLLIKGVELKTKGEYEISDHLFLITTSNLEAVRRDPAYEIKSFRNGKLLKSWIVPGSNWKIYLLSRSI